MSYFMAMRSSSIKALAIVVAFGAMSRAAVPYLPIVGPAPLRFQVAKKPAGKVVKFETGMGTPLVASNNLVSAGQGNPGNSTNTAVPELAAILKPAGTNAPDSERTLGDSFTGSVFELPEPDLVGISPEMLALYFHPVLSGTNLPAPLRHYPVSFMPPMPPDKESRAVYQVK